MKLHIHAPRIVPLERYGASGRLLGYNAVIQNLSEALVASGVEADETAPVHLMITPPYLYQRPAGKSWSIGLSMWESDKLPKEMQAVFEADLLIVPSSFCRSVFLKAGCRKPIMVVPLGIWPEHWPEPRQDRPGDTVRRFLWVGAPDTRKGIDVLLSAWKQAFWRDHPTNAELSIVDPRATLTIKTTVEPGLPAVGNHQLPGVSFITERLPFDELRQLYLAHDVFIFPSFGEGFGLPVLEAMAAGLLVISPAHTGLRDFVNRRVAWVLETKKAPAHYGVPVTIPVPKISHLKTLLRFAVDGDYAATATHRANAREVALSLTWMRTAEQILAVIRRYVREAVA